MPAQTNVENNFVGGLKTEYTGLNFPENACTSTENCVFSLIGDVSRRAGIDYETNYAQMTVDRAGKAISTYKWDNAGGDGLTQIVVEQIGSTLYFYRSSSATIASPLSTKILVSQITMTAYLPSGSVLDPSTVECQYADGNGYLFVYHPYLDPFYCKYESGTITASVITVQVRDFKGFVETGVADTSRPLTLSSEHNYNLQNQGWTGAPLWTATSSRTGANTLGQFNSGGNSGWNMSPSNVNTNIGFTVASGLSISNGTAVTITVAVTALATDGLVRQSTSNGTCTGTVTSYSGTTLTIFINSTASVNFPYDGSFAYLSISGEFYTIAPVSNTNTISAWQSAIGNYPSNVDVWWSFKNSSDTFAPATTINNVSFATTPAPKGHFILNAFNQDPVTVGGITGLTSVVTYKRPKTGAWFQGRVWYSGVDDSASASGDQGYYTWTENLYYSQIVTDPRQFGYCYQANDPTDENLFDILPNDGGVVTIQGSGAIYKLFALQNGMLVFAANGVWFVTGSQGIGFTATDLTIVKISGIRAMSSSSFVSVNGTPMFWNEEGIYTVQSGQQGGMTVEPITLATIQSYYDDIPHDSKVYARGAYNPIDYTIQWLFRSTQESGVTDRYEYDTILNLNTATKAFYPYTIEGTPKIHSILYVASPGGTSAPEARFKYACSVASGGSYLFTFADEHDIDYVDWQSYDTIGVDYSSFFVTGYKLHGQALRHWQPTYVYMYSNNEVANAYKLQGIWNYATSGNSGKYSSVQMFTNPADNFGFKVRRHKIRGSGTSLQLKVSSVTNTPFKIIGWAMMETTNQGI